MHIAAYVKEAMEETKYGDDFIKNIDVRVQEMNTAQLKKMFEHLTAVASQSGFKVWGDANEELKSKVEKVLLVRLAEDEAEAKRVEAIQNKIARKKELEALKMAETRRVMAAMQKNAENEAWKKVKENVSNKRYEDRKSMPARVAVAENIQIRMLQYIFVGFVVSVVVLSIFITDPVILGPGISGIFLICIYWLYRAYWITDIQPILITDDDMKKEYDELVVEFLEKAHEVIRLKEIEFKKRVKREKIERKEAVKKRKERLAYEAQMKENDRIELEMLAKASLMGSKAESFKENLSNCAEEKTDDGNPGTNTEEIEHKAEELLLSVGDRKKEEEVHNEESGVDKINGNNTVNVIKGVSFNPEIEKQLVPEKPNAGETHDRLDSESESEESGDDEDSDDDGDYELERESVATAPTREALAKASRLAEGAVTPILSRTPSLLAMARSSVKNLFAAAPVKLVVASASGVESDKQSEVESDSRMDAMESGLPADNGELYGDPDAVQAFESDSVAGGIDVTVSRSAEADIVDQYEERSFISDKDSIRIYPGRVQCVDMKENFAKEAVIIATLQPFPMDYYLENNVRHPTSLFNSNFKISSNRTLVPEVFPKPTIMPDDNSIMLHPIRVWHVTELTLDSISRQMELDQLRAEREQALTATIERKGDMVNSQSEKSALHATADPAPLSKTEQVKFSKLLDPDYTKVLPNWTRSYMSTIGNFKVISKGGNEQNSNPPDLVKTVGNLFGKASASARIVPLAKGMSQKGLGASSKNSLRDGSAKGVSLTRGVSIKGASLTRSASTKGGIKFEDSDDEFVGARGKGFDEKDVHGVVSAGLVYDIVVPRFDGDNSLEYTIDGEDSPNMFIPNADGDLEKSANKPTVLNKDTYITVAVYYPIAKMTAFMSSSCTQVSNAAARKQREKLQKQASMSFAALTKDSSTTISGSGWIGRDGSSSSSSDSEGYSSRDLSPMVSRGVSRASSRARGVSSDGVGESSLMSTSTSPMTSGGRSSKITISDGESSLVAMRKLSMFNVGTSEGQMEELQRKVEKQMQKRAILDEKLALEKQMHLEKEEAEANARGKKKKKKKRKQESKPSHIVEKPRTKGVGVLENPLLPPLTLDHDDLYGNQGMKLLGYITITMEDMVTASVAASQNTTKKGSLKGSDRHTDISTILEEEVVVHLTKAENERRRLNNHKQKQISLSTESKVANAGENSDASVQYSIRRGSVVIQKQLKSVVGIPVCSAIRVNLTWKSDQVIETVIEKVVEMKEDTGLFAGFFGKSKQNDKNPTIASNIV